MIEDQLEQEAQGWLASVGYKPLNVAVTKTAASKPRRSWKS
ncbi:hypothetical protein [Limnohabitans sp.]